MDENHVLIGNQDKPIVYPTTKKKIVPFSDPQILSPSIKLDAEKGDLEPTYSNSNASSFIPTKIDIEKELESITSYSLKESVPVSNCQVVNQTNSALSIEHLSNDLRDSISEFRSFLRSELSTLSERVPSSQSSSSPSISEKSGTGNINSLSNTILSIVKDNQRMLQILLKEPTVNSEERLQEEEKKTKMLSDMLESCIADNDTLSATIRSLRDQIQLHANAEMEYTLLYKIALEEAEQAEMNFKESQGICDQLTSELNEYKQHEPSEKVETLDVKPLPDPKLEEVVQQLNSYKFTNQLLVQQLAEERKRVRVNDANTVDQLNKRLQSVEKENEALKEQTKKMTSEIDELKQLLSKTDITDYQFIDDSSEE